MGGCCFKYVVRGALTDAVTDRVTRRRSRNLREKPSRLREHQSVKAEPIYLVSESG